MTNIYSYQTSFDYITGLEFEYIETYSFQRGKEFEDELELRKKRYIELQAQQNQRKLALDEKNEFTKLSSHPEQYVIDASGKLHSTAVNTNRFNCKSPEVERLVDILKIDAIDVPLWMCAPLYRDAIVFYNGAGDVVSTLNICFSCEYMSIGIFCHVNADVKTYRLLKQFFVELGHQIEEK